MSEYNQQTFKGGMNLLLDDMSLTMEQYRVGFNVRNRYGVLDPILQSKKDVAAPVGIKHEMLTFGNYIILFIAGFAYYRYYTDTGWQQITGFKMSSSASRYWTVSVPVATTNYARLSNPIDSTNITIASVNLPITRIQNIAAASFGNLPGLLVQDNINQPQFIYLDNSGTPTCRKTQSFTEWSITFTDVTNTVVDTDNREYVPIGNAMAWVDGVLYIASQDSNSIYRSVSGRPLDFVVNVNTNGTAGGDATTTSYSVGVGGIRCLRGMSDNSLFVAASNANFAVSKNMTQDSPKVFGEYTFIRTPLFEATCMSDRAIFDSTGDTRFIDLTGVRSFNAIKQMQNEGRNSPFTATIQSAFANIVQDGSSCAGILFDNYELYAVNTIYGSTIAIYDTIGNCWTAFDTNQTNGKLIKQLAKIELGIHRAFAITVDDELYTLYIGPNYDTAAVRTGAFGYCQLDQAGNTYKINNPKQEVKLAECRAILNKITSDCTCTVTPFVNNRLIPNNNYTKNIAYKTPSVIYNSTQLDINTQLSNLYWTFPNSQQGWKVFTIISWTGGSSLTQFYASLLDQTPMQPLKSQ